MDFRDGGALKLVEDAEHVKGTQHRRHRLESCHGLFYLTAGQRVRSPSWQSQLLEYLRRAVALAEWRH
jgi:hypothetical protein